MGIRQKIKITVLLVFCLYSAFFWIGATLAPILAHFKQYNLSAIFTTMYIFSCHQQPDRSFWLLGYPIALCCRCYGVYIGATVSSILAILNKLHINLKTFIILTVICSVDVFINYGLEKRLNTGNITRFVVGLIMGLLFTCVICYITEIKWRRKNEN